MDEGASFSGEGPFVVTVTVSEDAFWPRTPAVGELSVE